jgi:hypothetical protein
MLSLIQRILLRLRGDTLKLFFVGGALLLVWGTVAPVGTLVWWLSQGAEGLGLKRDNLKLPAAADLPTTKPTKIDCYIVYLPGVGDASSNELTPGEEFFLDRLQQRHPTCVIVSDVFPYSVANQDLGGQRFLAPLWQAVQKEEGWLKNAGILIKIRNLWRFAISADDRYAPVYNQGIATAILDRMNAAHPLSQTTRQPMHLILIGTSGGVQVALGAVPYLDKSLNPSLSVVSVGGAFDGEAGFNFVDRVYHLHGQRDWVDNVPIVLFASRWPWSVGSPFNQARQQGRYTAIASGSHTHDGSNGYFGTAIAQGQTRYVDLTLQQVDRLPIWPNP